MIPKELKLALNLIYQRPRFLSTFIFDWNSSIDTLSFNRSQSFRKYWWCSLVFAVYPCALVLSIALILAHLKSIHLLSTIEIMSLIFLSGCIIPVIVYCWILLKNGLKLSSAFQNVQQINQYLYKGKHITIYLSFYAT